MDQHALKTALHEGRRVYGTLVTSPSPRWLTVVPTLGLDFVFIDTEHIALDRLTLSWMCRGYAAVGLPPIVRIPNHDPFEATKVLDGGAAGVVAPYIEQRVQLLELLGAVGLRPLKGERLRHRLAEAGREADASGRRSTEDGDSSGGADSVPDAPASEAAFSESALSEAARRRYLEARNAASILVANIESTPALENLDSILSVPGLDAVLVGPHDLSVSLGVPEQYNDPTYVEAVDRIIDVARAAGVGAGIHMAYYDTEMKQEKRWIERGANLIIHSADILAFQWSMAKEIRELRAVLGDDGTDVDAGGEQI